MQALDKSLRIQWLQECNRERERESNRRKNLREANQTIIGTMCLHVIRDEGNGILHTLKLCIILVATTTK
jgi:hypothetical protein